MTPTSCSAPLQGDVVLATRGDPATLAARQQGVVYEATNDVMTCVHGNLLGRVTGAWVDLRAKKQQGRLGFPRRPRVRGVLGCRLGGWLLDAGRHAGKAIDIARPRARAGMGGHAGRAERAGTGLARRGARVNVDGMHHQHGLVIEREGAPVKGEVSRSDDAGATWRVIRPPSGRSVRDPALDVTSIVDAPDGGFVASTTYGLVRLL